METLNRFSHVLGPSGPDRPHDFLCVEKDGGACLTVSSLRSMNLWFLLLAVFLQSPLAAQQRPTQPFAIADNSFLVEEAFNQERGVFQNILLVQRVAGDWSFEFTQEWPLGGLRHQLSYTVPLEATHDPVADRYDWRRGSIALNYRLQVLDESPTRPALSPRLSLLVPARPAEQGYGVQFNLPASKQFGDVYLHGNAGYTVERISAGTTHRHVNTAGSMIYRAWPMLHLMVESVYKTNEYESANSLIVAPGLRGAVNFGRKQLVLGGSVPLGLLAQDAAWALLAYVSYELPF